MTVYLEIYSLNFLHNEPPDLSKHYYSLSADNPEQLSAGQTITTPGQRF